MAGLSAFPGAVLPAPGLVTGLRGRAAGALAPQQWGSSGRERAGVTHLGFKFTTETTGSTSPHARCGES